MKKISLIIAIALLITSCLSKKSDNLVHITGTILSGDIKEVIFYSVQDNPINLIDTSRSFSEISHSLIMNSLKGKTQEYILAYKMCMNLYLNHYDTTTYNAYMKSTKDEFSLSTVNVALEKYNKKFSLIGQDLHSSFKETLIEDTLNQQLTFEEMMANHKGKVVYLDLWSLKCGPCRTTMPHSKKLKERLSDIPIEFVYIAQDPYTKEVWDEIFEVSLTTTNHYRMVKHFWGACKMLKYLDIAYVPCYMIFDKEGKLISFNADRPQEFKNQQSKLEMQLRELANK